MSIAEGSIQNWCWSPLGWGMIFGLCCFAGWNIRILERGLQEYEALFMVAVFTASQVRRPLLLLLLLVLVLVLLLVLALVLVILLFLFVALGQDADGARPDDMRRGAPRARERAVIHRHLVLILILLLLLLLLLLRLSQQAGRL